ncbi:MAG: glycosyltransferase family 4 protein [Cyanobacteriota bacterium]|nr:glycosyltransferase family 4 protein [Cyanobacteriota bacterium]
MAKLARRGDIDIHVFYLWDFGVVETPDPGFGITLEWDIPLLDGYSYSFIPNLSKDPGNHHFFGYINPGLPGRIVRWKPDVIFLMNYAFLSYFLLLLDPRTWRLPILFRGDSHDIGRQDTLKIMVLKLIRRIVFTRFSAFLDVGENNREYILASGVPRSRLFRSPHAIDNCRFQDARPVAVREGRILRSKLAIGSDQVLISFVGKLIAIKRPFDLLRAFSLLPPEIRSRAALLFVGEGKLKTDLRSACRAGRLENVQFLDFQNQSAMPSIYAASDLLVLPSQNETWGLVVNEAMNLSCPAVVSDHVGCSPDLILPGRTGWVFPTGNVEALRDCLHQAVSDPAQLKQMGMNAAKHIAAFSFDSASAGLMDALAFVRREKFTH